MQSSILQIHPPTNKQTNKLLKLHYCPKTEATSGGSSVASCEATIFELIKFLENMSLYWECEGKNALIFVYGVEREASIFENGCILMEGGWREMTCADFVGLISLGIHKFQSWREREREQP
jgi:hypothetical protein